MHARLHECMPSWWGRFVVGRLGLDGLRFTRRLVRVDGGGARRARGRRD